MTDTQKKKALTHVAGTLLIEARGAFLNGAGLVPGEARTTTQHKTFRDGKHSVPYVSAQAWRRWLRRTLIEETGWPSSEIRAIAWSEKGTTSKVGGQTNPVEFAEDDLFGYMRAAEGQGSRAAREESDPEASDQDAGDADEGDTIAAVMRASPLATSVLASIRADGWQGRDDGFVHVQSHDPEALEVAEWLRAFQGSDKINTAEKKKLKTQLKGKTVADQLGNVREFAKKHGIEEPSPMPNPQSPLPYSTRFFNTDLEGVFLLDRSRVGVYWNLGDRKELDPGRIKEWLNGGKVRVVEDRAKQGKIYGLTDGSIAPSRCKKLIEALAVLRGGAKQAAFATDVAPKALVLAGLTCGNPIFNRLFRETNDGPEIDVERLKEVAKDYWSKLMTKIFVGIRRGYLANENEIRQLAEGEKSQFEVCTPIEAATTMAEEIT